MRESRAPTNRFASTPRIPQVGEVWLSSGRVAHAHNGILARMTGAAAMREPLPCNYATVQLLPVSGHRQVVALLTDGYRRAWVRALVATVRRMRVGPDEFMPSLSARAGLTSAIRRRVNGRRSITMPP